MNKIILRHPTFFRKQLLALGAPETKPHSPLFRAKHGLDERKAKIFDMKPDIPGRKAKLILSFCIVSFFWGFMKMKKRQEEIRVASLRTAQIFSRIIPFVQAMEDVRLCAIQEKNYLILQSICVSAPELFEELRRRYNQEDIL